MSDMTDEELDRARAEEAGRIHVSLGFRGDTAAIAARLAREGWTPPKPVDPDLIAAREACAANRERDGFYPSAANFREGEYDSTTYVQDALTAIKQTKAKFVAVLDKMTTGYDPGDEVDRVIARIREKASL